MDMQRDDQRKLSDDGLAAYYITRARCVKLLADVEKLTAENGHLVQVVSVLKIELGAVIHATRDLLTVLLNTYLPRYEPAWPEALKDAWREATEVIDSAAKCLT